MEDRAKSLVAWSFGIFFLLGSFGMFEESIIAGTIGLVMSVLVLPYTRAKIEGKIDWKFSTAQIVVMVIIGMAATGAFLPSDSPGEVAPQQSNNDRINTPNTGEQTNQSQNQINESPENKSQQSESTPQQDSQTFVTVSSITDGDTVDMQFSNGSTDTIRLLGVDTPETYGGTTPDEFEGIPDNSEGRQCLEKWGEKATQFAETKLEGKSVQIIFDSVSDRRGSYGRLLTYIYYDNSTSFNLQLIEEGYARVYESDFTNETIYLQAEKEAREENIGLWECTEKSKKPVVISYTQFDAPGRERSNLNGEYVTIKNQNTSTVNLEDWILRDDDGHSYKFLDINLPEGETVSIHTGSGSDTDSELYWGMEAPVWNNDGDRAYLIDGKGRTVDEQYAYG